MKFGLGLYILHLIVDSREQAPYTFSGDKYPDLSVETGTLQTGDYSLSGLTDMVAIERKSLDDLAGSLTTGRERFKRELARSKGLDFFSLVIEADMDQVARHEYRSQMKPKALIQSLFAFQVRYDLNVIWAGSRERGEYATYSLLQKYAAEQEKRLKTVMKAMSVNEKTVL